MKSIPNGFGSYRAFGKHLGALTRFHLGSYRQAAAVDWGSVERLVFVCKGNVCRSPYAHAKAAALGLRAESFGMDTSGNVPANPVAIRAAARRDVDLSRHRSRLFDRGLIGDADLIMTFEPDHFLALQRSATIRAQVSLLGLWSPRRRPFIADPYGKSEAYFDACFDVIDAALSNVAMRVTSGPFHLNRGR